VSIFGRRAIGIGVAAVLAAASGLGATGPTTAAVTYFGLTFPDRIAGAELGLVTDFEKTSPGLGYGVKYRQSDWAIDIYIYDDALPSIPAGPASEVLKSQREQAKGDINEMQRRGDLSAVKLLRDRVMRDRGGRDRLLCSDFNYVRKDMESADSFLCVTGWRNKFVKFRLTPPRHAGSDREANRFLDAWLGILWP
jgi:hypothetical protein